MFKKAITFTFCTNAFKQQLKTTYAQTKLALRSYSKKMNIYVQNRIVTFSVKKIYLKD